jgi:transposase-like protein
MSSSHAYYCGRPFRDYRNDKRVWLDSEFRVELIRDGIEKAGSINRLARELGYRSKIHPGWSVRQILVGAQPFPFEKLVKLSDYVGYPIEDVLQYRTEPDRVTVDSTNEALRQHGLWCYHIVRMRMR